MAKKWTGWAIHVQETKLVHFPIFHSLLTQCLYTYRRKLHFVGCKKKVVKIVTPTTKLTAVRGEIALATAYPLTINIAPRLIDPL